MQGSDNAFHSYLLQHGKGYLVFLAKPSPSLFHSLLLIFLFFRRSNDPLPFCKSKKEYENCPF